jgi:hypothetical protein
MSANLKVVSTPVPSPLELARAELDTVNRKLAVISDSIATLEQTKLPAEPGEDAQTLRQRLGQLLFRSGGKSTPEVDATERQLEIKARAERRGAAFYAELDGRISGLHAEHTAELPKRAAAQRSLDVARVEAFNAEIQKLMADYRDAAEAFFRGPHARLLAAGILSCEMCQDLNTKHGISVQSIGAPFPERLITLSPIAFGFADGGGYNQLRIDCGPAIAAAYSKLKQELAS